MDHGSFCSMDIFAFCLCERVGGGGGGYQLHSVGGEVSIQGNSFLGVDKKLLQTSEEEVT